MQVDQDTVQWEAFSKTLLILRPGANKLYSAEWIKHQCLSRTSLESGFSYSNNLFHAAAQTCFTLYDVI
jgi:hypothetical protein